MEQVMRTAGIVIIGDEILSGMVQDTNSFFITRELRRIGIGVRRISVIGDDLDEIAREVGDFSTRFDYVFTSGGIGPTHDDITIPGIARAFQVNVVIDSHLRDFLDKHYGGAPTPEQLRMAEAPEGAEIIRDATIGLPLIKYRNIFILPGIPEYLKAKVMVITKVLFNEKPPLLKKVYISEYESRIAPALNEIVNAYKEVKLGSYPVVGSEEYRVMVTMESFDEERLNAALQQFLGGFTRDKIVGVDHGDAAAS
jgi:molybdenum cofactor synthesis domain-containing protein